MSHYDGIMENLMFIQQMYFNYRKRLSKKRRKTFEEKMNSYRKSSAVLRIMNEIDRKLYDYQIATGSVRSGSVDIYRLSRKGYLKVFDMVNVNGAVKGLYSRKYTSRLRTDVVNRVGRPTPSAPSEEEYI